MLPYICIYFKSSFPSQTPANTRSDVFFPKLRVLMLAICLNAKNKIMTPNRRRECRENYIILPENAWIWNLGSLLSAHKLSASELTQISFSGNCLVKQTGGRKAHRPPWLRYRGLGGGDREMEKERRGLGCSACCDSYLPDANISKTLPCHNIPVCLKPNTLKRPAWAFYFASLYMYISQGM